MTDSHRQVSGGEDTPSVAGRRSSGAASVVPAGVPAARAPLVAREIRAGYAERTVLEHLDIAIPAGAFTVIVGPNACGKSTLLRVLSRLLAPASGQVLLDGWDLHAQPSREVARRLGLLPQSSLAPEGITVEELVSRGRAPHQSFFARWSRRDEAAVEQALAATGTTSLRHRYLEELSGGQRQRVWIAMALAQQTDVLLLDEPTTFLDLAHQVEVLDLLDQLRREGRTVVAVLHELNHAARYATHLVVMSEGAVVAHGPPGEVVTEELVERVFGLRCHILRDPLYGVPVVLPG